MRVRLLLTLAVALSFSASVASTRDLFRTNAALWQTPQAAPVKSFTHDGVAGIDGRFAFAAPVYGCAFLLDHSVWTPQMRRLGAVGARWDALWDARNFLPFAKMPVLWCTGTNDYFFPLDSLQRGCDLLPQPPSLSVKVRMPHGHPPAGDPREIAAFADSVVFGRPALPKVTSAEMRGGALAVSWRADSRRVAQAFLVRTASRDGNWSKRAFDSVPVAFSGASLTAAVPPDSELWYVNLVTDDGLVVSTRHFVWRADGLAKGMAADFR